MSLSLGDWVKMRNVAADAAEYDEGQIIAIGLGDEVTVLWTIAKTTYRECVDELEVLQK